MYTVPVSPFQLPTPVIAIVAEELAEHFTHAKIDVVFAGCGAPGEPPVGNKVVKCGAWLRTANADSQVDKSALLGGILQEVMEVDPTWEPAMEIIAKRRERIGKVLAKHGLQYRDGGQILGATTGAPTKSLETTLRARDLVTVEQEFQRSLHSVEADPAASVTAASAIVEALCKVYIHDEKIDLPKDQTIKPLWGAVQKHLGLDPAQIEDEDLKRILSGLSSIVDGLGAFRTHAGSAHGRGRRSYRIQPRHARLAIHAAHTLTQFVLETWDDRKTT